MKINSTKWIVGFMLFLCLFSCKSEWTWMNNPPEIPEEKPSPVVFSFSESEIAFVAFLVELIPSNIRVIFEEKYLAWVESWERYKYQSWYRAFAQSEEYFDLLDYCKKHGKALYPLVIDRIIFEPTFKEENLLQDYMYNGDNWDRDFNPTCCCCDVTVTY